MRRAVLVFVILALYILGGVALIGNHGDSVLPSTTYMPSTATLFVNESGVFVRVPLSFNRMWVDGIIITPDTWLINNYKVEVEEGYDPEGFVNSIIGTYMDKMIPINKELGRGIYVFNVTGHVETGKITYPIWHGKVVVGDKTVKLSDIGRITPIREKVISGSAVLIVDVIQAYVVDAHPVILSDFNDTGIERRAYALFREGKIGALVEYAKEVTRDIIRGIENGSIVIGYYGQPFSKEFATEQIESKQVWLTVTLDVGYITANATVTTSCGVKYYVETYRHISITIDSRTMDAKTEYSVEEELEPLLPVPVYSEGALIVVYRETPYSPYRVLVMPVKAAGCIG